MTRNQPACVENSEYLAYVRQNYLTRLRENLPSTVLERDCWLTPPPIMQEVSDDSFTIYKLSLRHVDVEVSSQTAHVKLFFFLQVSQLLKKLYIRCMVRKYVRGITPQRKAQVQTAACQTHTVVHTSVETDIHIRGPHI